jgi:hypothetical protein
MNKLLSHSLTTLFGVVISASSAATGPTGAKALFDSGEGTTVGMSVGYQPASPATAGQPAKRAAPTTTKVAKAPAKDKYVGISYQILTLADDGRMTAVDKSRAFRTGERVKIIARTNRPGYLAVLNRGSSGRTNVLYHDYVDPFSMIEVPKNGNLRFVGSPGKEEIVLMLSDQPNPIALQAGKPPQGVQPAAPLPAASYSASTGYPPAQDYGRDYTAAATPPAYPAANDSSGGGYSPGAPPMASTDPSGQSYGATMMASLDGAKSVRGAKDLVIDDGMESSYAVVSPRNGYRPVDGGMKDLVLESHQGTHYGVVPVSAVGDSGMLTLKMTLVHR